MGVDDGDVDYGFARRGDPERKRVGRRAAAPVGPPPSKKPRLPHPPVLSGDRAPLSQKPPWVWLLIGFLIGTGGTLLTSSFWLSESGRSEIAGLEASDPLTSGHAEAKAATLPPPAADDLAPDEPRPAPTSVAALNAEERKTPPTAPKAALTAEEAGSAFPDRDEPVSASDIAVKSEPPKDGITDTGHQVIAAEPPAPRRASEQALAALESKSHAQPRTVEPAGGPDVSPTRPASPSPSAPATSAAARLPAAASRDGAESVAAALTSASSSTLEAGPATAVDRAELPPRIRQALLAAKAERQTTSKQGATRGGRLYRVQLAAVDNEVSARLYWREINERLPGVFADVEPIFNQRVVDERSYLRIWVGAFDSRGDADGYCVWLKEQGQDCFVTRVDNL